VLENLEKEFRLVLPIGTFFKGFLARWLVLAFDLRTVTKRQALLVLAGLSAFFFWWSLYGRTLLLADGHSLLTKFILYYVLQYGPIVYFFYLAVKRRNND